jgi:hypothetical protein
VAARRGFGPGPGKPGIRIAGGLVERVVDLDPALELTSAPLWLLGPDVAAFLDGLAGPPFELKDAFQRAIDAGHPIAGVEIGRTRDLTDPLDLVKQNFPYLGSL